MHFSCDQPYLTAIAQKGAWIGFDASDFCGSPLGGIERRRREGAMSRDAGSHFDHPLGFEPPQHTVKALGFDVAEPGSESFGRALRECFVPPVFGLEGTDAL